MEQDISEKQAAVLSYAPRVYTYAELVDNETFLSVTKRLTELSEKSDRLTDEELAEFNGMHPAWFKHMFDPI
ncbi:hypothetical protein A3F00_02620 [Candidatus Daviesbacteria bacterium RIFCSPHIGHO2_12_FULL_37_11]|uniref:Uncharacterized protein n=1 Tax=Candidatus Daviesbacteria bacterium RIFCSPHIGHO2_12_FULL_37_11 TaxID=1797777 RepID=A0A1F5KEP4_9BACT|nr:MAG: hypothetical protein A2769_00490 [Candidatus Daviesbacteria bacterium RIFCSPHIGHO2_01_FULL_37_27]OGE39329.1 MAG: hypothetical protein A3F00_02620 [Candidatus Daviesbacteria bacterium RIFCSPHIGHO2_12_FULL_37_11]OGE45371.1 MAG: hypothetical protein A3B39_03040 [Candidatus Daviesbacteria bacterium RIFCSPLOWO2_01_FULL_37_10]